MSRVKVRTKPGLPAHARLLLAIRRKYGWTQGRLAAELAIHKSTVANWETGRTDPHLSWVAKLEALLAAEPMPAEVRIFHTSAPADDLKIA